MKQRIKQKGVMVYSKYEDYSPIVIFRISSHVFNKLSQETKNYIMRDAVEYARTLNGYDRIDGANWVNVGR